MSEAILLQQPVNKPGTSCLGCRRRKLKCSREAEGCVNCTKSDLPCVYPAPEVGVKKKRGPYKKDKPARQRHLEDLVKYLEPKGASPETGSHHDSGSSSAALSPGRPSASTNGTVGQQAAHLLAPNGNSEDLVKDALIALTKSSVSEQDSRLERGAFLSNNAQPGVQLENTSPHPPIRRIFEYWHIYQKRVDPLMKIIHCPTFGDSLFKAVDNLNNISPSFEALMFGVYYAAISSCTAREVRERFGDRQDVLKRRYGRCVEMAMGDNYDIPALESLQALVLYITCIRRQDDETNNLRALFGLAVRSAQIMGLHQDSDGRYSPFEAEYRRRLWYHICSLENRTAEEGATRSTSIMQSSNARMPSNLNDCDLDPSLTEPPQSRTGITEMGFVLMRFECQRLMNETWSARKPLAGNNWSHASPSVHASIREEQVRILEQGKERLRARYREHLDPSRPYDWMCLHLVDGLLVKNQLAIDFPFGTIPTRAMSEPERNTLLKASVDVIQFTHILAFDPRVADWQWFFRGYVQWHSIAIVVAELSQNPLHSTAFVDAAWQALDPVLNDWEVVYRSKRGEAAWDHVNALIERARSVRNSRKKRFPAASKVARVCKKSEMQPGALSAQGIAPIYEAPRGAESSEHVSTPSGSSEYTSGQGSSSMMDFDASNLDFGEGMPEIDLASFDEVFGGGSWDFLEPLDDVNLQIERIDRCQRHMGYESGGVVGGGGFG